MTSPQNQHISPHLFPPGFEGESNGNAPAPASSLPFAPMPHQSLGAALGLATAKGPVTDVTPYQRGPPEEYLARIALQQQARVEDAEDLDMTASHHGDWTLENAKGKLHQFLQLNKINVDYKYSAFGSDHTRSFAAEMGFFVNSIRRHVVAKEPGSNKQTASKACALSLVRQLFHLKAIEAFTGTLARKKEVDAMPPFEVGVKTELRDKIIGFVEGEFQGQAVAEWIAY
jgi:ATP-dependent RNA helicase A